MKKYMILASLLAATGSSIAYAEDGANEQAEGKAVFGAKVSLVQAVTAAEAQAGGKASSVNFTMPAGNGAPFFHVEVIAADGSQQDLAVDAESGEVSKAIAIESEDDGSEQGDQD